jgi:hypothetical protein
MNATMRGTHPHTRLRRLTAVIWALLFLVTGAAEGFGTHVCAHHDPVLAALAAQGAGVDHAAPAVHGEQHPGHDAGQPAHSGCTCIGTCQVGGALLLPTTAPQAAVALVVDAPVASHAVPLDERLPGRTPHTLPFAQAPPALG